MKEKGPSFYPGMALAILALVLFLMHVRIGSRFHFYSFGYINTGALCVIMIIVTFIALLVVPCFLTKLLFAAMMLIFVVVILVSMNIYLVSMNALSLFLILAPGCAGIAMMIRGLLPRRRR